MVVDMHFHLMPPGLTEDLRAGRLPGVTWREGEDGRPAATFPGRAPAAGPSAILDWPKALAHVEAAGVDRVLVTPWVSATGDTLDGPSAVTYARRMNEAMAEAIAGSGGRMAAMATLPTAAPAEVEAALREAVGLGLRGVHMPTHGSGEALDAPRFEAVWRAAELLGQPVFLHPPNLPHALLDRFGLGNLLGNPLSTGTAAATLIFGGVLDRHPGLKVVLAHGGGTLPYGIGRLDHGFGAGRAGTSTSAERPSAYLRRFWYDAVVYRPEALRYLVETVGADRVMVGTDYPFDMEMPTPRALVERALADRGEGEAVLSGTASRLFGWP